MSTDFLVQDSGEPDEVAPEAMQYSLDTLPVDVLVYLLGSRYCETDRLSNIAWSRFGNVPKGWPLVQAICDYVYVGVRRFDEVRHNRDRVAPACRYCRRACLHHRRPVGTPVAAGRVNRLRSRTSEITDPVNPSAASYAARVESLAVPVDPSGPLPAIENISGRTALRGQVAVHCKHGT
jgi:hypothetical protein